jgi:hypothetical protein
MKPNREGLSAAALTGVVVVLIVVVLGAAYVGPSMLAGSSVTHSTTSQSAGSTSNNPDAALLPLFGHFSQMQLQESVLNNPMGGDQTALQQVTFSYLVLGKGTINSTQYTKVLFSQAGLPHNVLAWFNPQGGIDRVDVSGQTNYTGSGAKNLPTLQVYLTGFRVLAALATNTTLISMLSKTSENITTIGPSQLTVTTYSLAVPTRPYTSITAKFAAIPGTNERLLVYFDAKMTGGSETTVEVLSLTK